MLARELGPDEFASFLDTIARGELDVEQLTTGDHARAAGLMRIYKDLKVASSTAQSSRLSSGSVSRS